MRFIFKRLWESIPVIFAVLTITFFLVKWTPGAPFDRENSLQPNVKRALEAHYGYDKRPLAQYLCYLKNLCKGDLGPSLQYPGKTTVELLKERIPLSLKLGGLSIAVICIFGIGFGILAAWKPNSFLDNGIMMIAMTGVCSPPFVIGPLLILLVGLNWNNFTFVGYTSPRDLLLPCLTQSYLSAASITKLMRNNVVDLLDAPYIRTAHAKGLSQQRIFFTHLLKNALPTTIAYLGPTAAIMLSGSLVVESLFHLPGAGSLFIQAIYNRDDPVIIGTVLFFASLIFICNLLADILLAIINPRHSTAS